MEKIPLNELVTLQRGFDLPKDKRINGEIPVVASTGIVGFHNEAKVKANGVVIGRSGSIGGGQYITEDFFPLNTTLYVKDFKGHNPRFIYYLFRSIDFTKFNVGSGVPTLNRNHLSSLLVAVLSHDKESKIARILGDLDDKIHLTQQTNQTLEHIATAIFKSWFVDFDPVRAKSDCLANSGSMADANLSAMSVISGKSPDELAKLQTDNPQDYDELWQLAEHFPCELVENAEFGEVPKGWEVVPLDKIAHYQNGLALQKFRPENDDEFLPVIKIAQLRQGYADNAEKASVNITPKCIIDNGDVIFSWSGSLLVDIWCGGKGALNQHLFKVTSENYPKWFYYLWTKHHLAEFQRIAEDKAVTMGHIKREHLSQALCSVPSDNFLNLCTSIQQIIGLIIANRIEGFNLAKIRDELLPKLLSGEIEL